MTWNFERLTSLDLLNSCTFQFIATRRSRIQSFVSGILDIAGYFLTLAKYIVKYLFFQIIVILFLTSFFAPRKIRG